MRRSQDARGTNREAGEDRLAMISGSFRRALAQLPKFGSERVIHAESLAEFPRNILPAGAPRAEVNLLENTEVRPGFANGGSDAIEMSAAIDVPVEDSYAGAERG